MDRMAAAGLKVILDIPGQPAPVWLHRKYPGVDIVTQHGVHAHRRVIRVVLSGE